MKGIKSDKIMQIAYRKIIADPLKNTLFNTLLQIATKIITNYDSSGYYKLRRKLLQIAIGRLLQIATILLQITTGITNYDKSYYKLRQVLQIVTLLQIVTVHTHIYFPLIK